MNLQTLAWIFAVVFLVVGVLGFIPGITTDGMLLGIFEVDTTHNIIHIVFGLFGLWVAMASMANAKMYFKVVGVVYGLVTILGFIDGMSVLGLFGVNMADNILHLVITAVALWAGFGMKEGGMAGGGMGMGGGMGGGMKV